MKLFRKNKIANPENNKKRKLRNVTVEVRPRLFTILSEVFYEYAHNTKLSGLYYLRRGITSGYVRFLWTCIPILVFLFGGLLMFELIVNFFDKPTVIVIDKPQPVENVPFPGITYCHPQTVIDFKSQQFVSKLVIPTGVTVEKVLDVIPSLGMFVENQWSSSPNMDDLRLIDQTLELNNYTVSTAVNELGLNCRDFIKVCAWAKVEFPCFQENSYFTFVTTTSYLGICCSFNYHPANASYEPYHSPSFGTRGGLSIIGSGYPQADLRSGALFSSGFIMMIHHPKDFPVEGNPVKLIEIGVITSVAVYPTLSQCTDDVLALPSKSRRCVQPSDLDGDNYRQPACDVECTRDYIYRTCGCHPFYLPYPKNESSVRECRAVDAACFSEHMSIIYEMNDTSLWQVLQIRLSLYSFPIQSNLIANQIQPCQTVINIRTNISASRKKNAIKTCDKDNVVAELKKGQCSYCMPSCTDITYISRSYSNPYNLRNGSFNVQPIYKSINVTKLKFTVHVYLANQVVRVQTQMIVTSLINLLSNFGGVFNLCLGISVISIAELIFYSCFRVPQRSAAKNENKFNVVSVKAMNNQLQIF